MPESSPTISPARIGIVLIGKNEGQRLVEALAAAVVADPLHHQIVVYVDSNSTDNSVISASSAGAHVVVLDRGAKFTAALARNAGLAKLRELMPDVEFVQFIDGDCTLDPNWIGKAVAALRANAKLAGVCGRRREKFPEKSIYNRLCDDEWNTPVGLTQATGGDAMFRRDVLDEVGGYDATLIAGEEPEMCRRIAARGWLLERLDLEMTRHDADMTRFGQWWKRHVRAGHAFAQVSSKCLADRGERFWVSNVRGNYFWGCPLVWALWPIQWVRLLAKTRQPLIASNLLLSKLPQMLGQLMYLRNKRAGTQSTLIEYKPHSPASADQGQTVTS